MLAALLKFTIKKTDIIVLWLLHSWSIIYFRGLTSDSDLTIIKSGEGQFYRVQVESNLSNLKNALPPFIWYSCLA